MTEVRENEQRGFVGMERSGGRLSLDRVETKQEVSNTPPELEFGF